jgi:hypothetical protein
MDRFGGLAPVCGPGFFFELEGRTGDDVWENAVVIELTTTAADRATAKSFLRTQSPVETEECKRNHRSIGRADVKAQKADNAYGVEGDLLLPVKS